MFDRMFIGPFIKIIWIICAVVIFFRVIRFAIYCIRSYRLKIAVQHLGFDPDDANVYDFIEFIMSYTIPNKPAIYNKLRAVHSLIQHSSNVDRETKHKVRQVLLSKGIKL